MLYLNFSLCTMLSILLYLTLTSVVFEYKLLLGKNVIESNLTLTSVVFEFV